MRDSKDHATLELPGLMPAAPVPMPSLKRAAVARSRKMALRQEQLELLEADNPPDSLHLQRDLLRPASGRTM
jgi:hypothetical protein